MEEQFQSSHFENFDVMFNIGRAICKICYRNILGTGFLIKLEKGNNDFYCLMSNEHVITKEVVQSKEIIQVFYENQNKNVILRLDKNERYIEDYKYLNIDIIVIEILPKDNIHPNYFLLPNINYITGYEQFKEKDIFLPQYPKGGPLKYSKGKINHIYSTTFQFGHSASTNDGSSGSPIFLLDSMYVIGIHKQGSKSEKYANFIGPIIDSLKMNYAYVEVFIKGGFYQGKINNNKREGYGKFTFMNGDYYIGQWFNDKMHGLGIKYRQNGIIKYEGQFEENKYKGTGKYIFDNGDYYIGDFNYNKGNGKGKYYDCNNILIYEGDIVNNMREGFGTYYYNKDNYYVGYWKNGQKHGSGKYYENKNLIFSGMHFNGKKFGKGIEFYENGDIKYDGQFANDKYEGEGVLYFEKKYSTDDNDKDSDNSSERESSCSNENDLELKHNICYTGGWKNGKKNGKGIEYFRNGKLKYDGAFINDEYNGFGVLNYYQGKNKYNYSGNFVNGKKHGKGTLKNTKSVWSYYNYDRMIEYKGNFANDMFEGYGESTYRFNYSYKGEWKNNNFDGKGDYYSDNVIIYSGYYSEGLKTKEGIEFYENGNPKYIGSFFNDKYDGKGTYYYENGDYFEGQWINGEKHGYGKKYNRNGELIFEGEFINDKPVNKVPYFFNNFGNFMKDKFHKNN